MQYNRSFTGKLTILLLIGYSFLSQGNLAVKAEDEFDKEDFVKGIGHFVRDSNPGVQIRVEKESIDKLKMALQHFLPHYMLTDMGLPRSYEFDIGLGEFCWGMFTSHVIWSEIDYKDVILDIEEIKITFTDNDAGMGQKLQIDFPAIKSLAISAHQDVDDFFAIATGDIDFEIKSFDAKVVVGLTLTDYGTVHPIFHDVTLKFGDTNFAFENWFLEFISWQTIEFTKVMLENSIYFVGPFLLTDMMGPNIDRELNGYQLPVTLKSPVDEEKNIFAHMMWDLRNSQKPNMHDGFIDLFFMGELLHLDLDRDECDWNPQEMPFAEPKGDVTTNSQIVISENAATCSLRSIARSPIGLLRFSTDRLNKMFGMFPNLPRFEMNTKTVGKVFSLFKKKLDNRPLQMFVRMKDVDVKFGEYDTDIILSYTACLDFRYEEEHSTSFFYDELNIITDGSVRIDSQNILQMTIFSHKLDTSDQYEHRTSPIKDTLNTSQQEYNEFKMDFSRHLNDQKEWINTNVLKKGRGLHLPMGADEINVDVNFDGGRMHLFAEIQDGVAQWLETEWWDKKYKEEKGVEEHDQADWDWIDGETWQEKDQEDDQKQTWKDDAKNMVDDLLGDNKRPERQNSDDATNDENSNKWQDDLKANSSKEHSKQWQEDLKNNRSNN